jgi:hypothetical protein
MAHISRALRDMKPIASQSEVLGRSAESRTPLIHACNSKQINPFIAKNEISRSETLAWQQAEDPETTSQPSGNETRLQRTYIPHLSSQIS